MINDLMSAVSPYVSAKSTAVYIKPPIPSRVSSAPKILLRFISYVFKLIR